LQESQKETYECEIKDLTENVSTLQEGIEERNRQLQESQQNLAACEKEKNEFQQRMQKFQEEMRECRTFAEDFKRMCETSSRILQKAPGVESESVVGYEESTQLPEGLFTQPVQPTPKEPAQPISTAPEESFTAPEPDEFPPKPEEKEEYPWETDKESDDDILLNL
jgi:hypothetical protein